MTTTEVVKLLAKRLKTSQKTARLNLRSLLAVLAGIITNNKELQLPDLGFIEVKEYKPRNCYIPKKGYCLVPKRLRAVFKISAKFKSWIKGQKDEA